MARQAKRVDYRVDYLAPAAAGGGLGRTAARGTAVTLLGQWSGFVMQTVSVVVLARLLTPHDYGIVTGVLVLTGLAELLKDLGLGAATIQRRDLTDAQLNSLFWVNVALGVVTAAAVAAAAPLVADFYGQPESAAVTVALAIPFLFSGTSVQHQALLSRTLQFSAMARIDLVSRAVGLGAAVTAAVLGAGYWALVVSPLVTSVLRCAQLWRRCTWRPSRPAWAHGMRPLLGFGGWTSMFGIVNYVSRNADNALIGRYEGAADLGVYSRAYQLLLLPLQQINAPLARVAIPTLSRLQDQPARYRRFYETAMTAIAYVTLPLVALLAVLADEIVLVLLGKQWHEAAPIFRVLALAGIGMTLGQANGWLYQTTGHARRQALSGLVTRSITVASFVVGLRWGTYGVAVAFTISTTLLTVPSFALATLGAPVSMAGIGRAIWRPAVVALATFGVAELLHRGLDPHFGAVVVLVLVSAGALATYAGLVAAWPAARSHWREIVSLLRPTGGTKRG